MKITCRKAAACLAAFFFLFLLQPPLQAKEDSPAKKRGLSPGDILPLEIFPQSIDPRKLVPDNIFDGPAPLIGEENKVKPPAKIPPEFQSPQADKPWLMRMMIHDIHRGMFIGLPIIDTDPNRGTTYGIMPIWVMQEKNNNHIQHIHAPSITYNDIFKWVPTYRYYFYPTEKSNYFLRASAASQENPDLVGEMEDQEFLGRDIAVSARVTYDTDGSNRFFGVGPDTKESSETNFTKKFLGYFCRIGLPIFQGSKWKWNIAHRLAATRIASGQVDSLDDIGIRFPEDTPSHWHQDSEIQFFMDYDTRDSNITTQRGMYAKIMIENAQRQFASEYTFTRYLFDLRRFYHTSDQSRFTTAARFRLEQLVGDVPFHLMPSLGGKMLHRAYGEGRYIDKGMFTAALEERIRVFQIETAGVMTEIEVAPFVGMGSVFKSAGKVHRRFIRPVVGGAIRAIARPQVVGSIDFGIGQEGPAIFMDINYSF